MTPYEDQPFNRLAFKASHNSYDQETGDDLRPQLGFDPAAPADFGCRGLELDLVQTADRREWEVRHSSGWRPALGDPRRARDRTRPLSHWLGQLGTWADAQPAPHDPVTVVLDLKEVHSSAATFAADLHGYLADCGFTPDRLFRPPELKARGYVWPTLGELRGHFILVLSGLEEHKRRYARLSDTWSFADRWLRRGQRSGPDLSKDSRVIVNVDCAGRYGQRLDWACRDPALWVRVYNVNGQRDWREVRAAGANMLATDALTGTTWARVCSDAAVCEWGLIGC